MRKWLDDMLEQGYLCPSKSPITSSMFYVPKKDGEDCPVQDYCILNKYTVKDNSPLLNIKQTVANLVHAFVFTKFDIRWGYNNIWIKKGDEWKAVFKTPFGVFELMVMFFGLTNSPATFQTMMNHIF